MYICKKIAEETMMKYAFRKRWYFIYVYILHIYVYII